MKTRTVLLADEGMVITDGKVYGKTVHLAEGVSGDDFYEITQKEYEKIEAEIANNEE